MREIHAVSVALLLWLLASPGCAGKPLVHGWLDSEGTIYRQAEQEDFGTRTTIRVRGFEF